jgi:hypothetical protein
LEYYKDIATRERERDMQNTEVKRVNACEVSRNEDGTFHVIFLNGPQMDYRTPERTFEQLVMTFGCDPVKAHEALLELGAQFV